MATAVFTSPLTSTADRPSALVALAKRFVNALVASRIEAAERELHRHERLIHETALVYGEYRRIGLNKADLLPFNA
jgi:hypothetical protein